MTEVVRAREIDLKLAYLSVFIADVLRPSSPLEMKDSVEQEHFLSWPHGFPGPWGGTMQRWRDEH